MKGNDHADILFEVMHEDMASALVIHDEADPAKGLDDFFAGEGPAHKATSICLNFEFGFVLI